MTEAAPPPAALALRRELEFVKSLLKSGRSVDEMMAAARAAARVAARAAEEAKRNLNKGATELTIRGLPAGCDWDWRSFKRWLQSVGLPQRAIKYTDKDPALDWGVVQLASVEDCNVAFDLLPTSEPPQRGTTVVVEKGVPAGYGGKSSRKRGREGEADGEGEAKKEAKGEAWKKEDARQQPRPRPGKGGPPPSDIREVVCPWWQVPYSQQLTDKHQRIAEALAAITVEVDRRTYGSSKPDWVRAAHARASAAMASAASAAAASSAASASALCCPLLGILRSPSIEHYRNKSEFTAGVGRDERPEVGYLLGSFQDGITSVVSPAGTRHTSAAALQLAAAAAAYIRDVSKFDVYDKRSQLGYWRLVLVREGHRKSFLPVPVKTSAAAAAATSGGDGASAAAAPPTTTLHEAQATFTSLDPFTYLVTFGGQQATEQAVQKAEEKKQEGEGKGEKMAEEGAEAMEVEAAEAGASSAAAASAAGMDIGEVCEAEPARPPPDEVLVMLQVNPEYGKALADPAAAALELRAMTAALHAAATAAGLPLTTVRLQLHSGVSNAAPADAAVLELPPAPEAPALPPALAAAVGGADAGAAAAAEAAAAAAEPPEVAAAVAAAAGPGYIYDALCELRFRISPTAFFQVNSPATCALYKVIGDWAAASPKTLLLDICCGTGTIGLTMASRVHKVIGVDSVPSAVEDARVNAALNGITNAEFVAGKAEDALPGILDTHAGSGSPYGPGDVVAVADPPRAGLHRTVLRALLGCERIRRLVFVSCNPDNLVHNVSALCCPPENRSGRNRGGGGRGYHGGGVADMAGYSGSYTPFRPVKALAVDLFPHTAHVEAVMLLER